MNRESRPFARLISIKKKREREREREEGIIRGSLVMRFERWTSLARSLSRSFATSVTQTWISAMILIGTNGSSTCSHRVCLM